MDTQSFVQRVEQACGELGLNASVCETIVSKAIAGQVDDGADGGIVAELARLREENARLTSERERWIKVEREVMQLLGTSNPSKIIHDLRNLLNELALLQALTSEDS